MSRTWRVRLTDQAELDLLGIASWTAENFGPRQAEQYVETILQAMENLTDGPETLGTKAREELAPYLTAGRELRFVYEAPAEAFVVLGERAMVTALLVNLLKNALEAAGEAGPVIVTVDDPPSPRLVIDNPGEAPPERGCGTRWQGAFVSGGAGPPPGPRP